MSSYTVELTDAARADLAAIEDNRTYQAITRRLLELRTEPGQRGKSFTGDLKGYRSVRAAGQRYRRCKDGKERIRRQAIWLYAREPKPQQVSQVTGLSHNWVYELIKRYNAEGPAVWWTNTGKCGLCGMMCSMVKFSNDTADLPPSCRGVPPPPSSLPLAWKAA